MAKRILFVTAHFPPNDAIGTQRMTKLMKYLHRRGWQVFVLTLREDYFPNARGDYRVYLPDSVRVYRTGKLDPFEIWDWLKRRLGRTGRAEAPAPGRSSSKSEHSSKSGSGWWFELKELVTRILQYPDRYNGWIPFIFWKAWRIIRNHRIDYVLVSSPPHSPHLPINWLHRWLRFTYIADFRDPWARSQWVRERDHLYQRLQHRLDDVFEGQTVREADLLIYNTDHLREDFEQFYGTAQLASRAFTLTNGFDPEMKVLLGNGRMREEEAAAGRQFIIRHTGNLYKKRNPEPILQALAEVKARYPEAGRRVRLEFIGPLDEALHYLHGLVESLGLEKQVAFLPSRPYLEILNQLHQADWLLLLQPGTTIQVPAKFFDYLLSGRPIWAVVEPESVGERLVREMGNGFVSYSSRPETLRAFFQQLIAGRLKPSRPRSEALERFSAQHLAEQLEEILLASNGQKSEKRASQ
ncbi:MAG: hypothetical protein D6715_00980 [Calditrichaeota bacterium]|nr:MAG: hypothetical protein D6715_00980 [Calditrichota bacterium]